jgi:hypothetical protein
LQLPTCILQIPSVGFSFDLLVFRSNNLGTQRTGAPLWIRQLYFNTGPVCFLQNMIG